MVPPQDDDLELQAPVLDAAVQPGEPYLLIGQSTQVCSVVDACPDACPDAWTCPDACPDAHVDVDVQIE